MQTQAPLCSWPALLSEIAMCQSHDHVTHQTIHLTHTVVTETRLNIHSIRFIHSIYFSLYWNIWTTLNMNHSEQTPGRINVVQQCQNLGPWNHKRGGKKTHQQIPPEKNPLCTETNLIQNQFLALVKWSWNVQDAVNGVCPSGWRLLHQTERNAGVLDRLQKLDLSQISSAHWCQPTRVYQITRNPFLNTM